MLRRTTGAGRRGSILPLVSIALIALMGMVALATDIGIMAVARTQAQGAADIAALAGTRQLTGTDPGPDGSANNVNTALSTGSTAATNNSVMSSAVTSAQVTVTPTVYTYDSTAQRFTAMYPAPATRPTVSGVVQPWSALTVNVTVSRPTFFAKVFNISSYGVTTTATAVHRPRDVAFVLDFSGSMHFSSGMFYPQNAAVTGSMNPDTRVPAYGPWSTMADALIWPPSTLPTSSGGTSTSSVYVDNGGEAHAPSNATMDSMFNGPRVVADFTTFSGGSPVNAFVNSTTDGSPGSWTPTSVPATPAPADFATQSSATATYGGQLWPQRNQGTATSGQTWAKDLLDFLTTSNSSSDSWTNYGSFPTGVSANNCRLTAASTSSVLPSRFKSSGAAYIPTGTTVGGVAGTGSSSTPGFVEPLNPSAPLDAEGFGPNFKDYSMGPAFWGKTFFTWPPDPRYSGSPTTVSGGYTTASLPNTASPDPTRPGKDTSGRWMADWRKRFFVYGSSPPSGRNAGDRMDDNSLLWNSSGVWQSAGSSRYQVDYAAVLKWLKTGPQTLPSNLRSGRVVYYMTIPDDVNTGTGSADDKRDKYFWKAYIDYVIGTSIGSLGDGSACNPVYEGYGTNGSTQGFGTTRITARSSLTASRLPGDPTGGPYTGPPPYMRYDDNPVHPRTQFWFGPLSMLDFLVENNAHYYNWWPGTCHEAHDWHLKAGIQAAFNDIQKNHPNDLATLIYFSHFTGYFTPRVTLGRNYTRMKNALWFPFPLLAALDAGDTSSEVRPFNDPFSTSSDTVIPNAHGGTGPDQGFMSAYNQFSSASGYAGRRGAAKVVVFETDGVPNEYVTSGGSFQNGGAYNSYYSTPTAATYLGNGNSTVENAALAVVSRICALDSASAPGYSSTRTPARIHGIAFGQLFETSTTSTIQQPALQFILDVQIAGNTSPAGATLSSVFGYPSYTSGTEPYKVIVGDYNTRISNIRNALQRIMQSGVQVSLIE